MVYGTRASICSTPRLCALAGTRAEGKCLRCNRQFHKPCSSRTLLLGQTRPAGSGRSGEPCLPAGWGWRGQATRARSCGLAVPRRGSIKQLSGRCTRAEGEAKCAQCRAPLNTNRVQALSSLSCGHTRGAVLDHVQAGGPGESGLCRCPGALRPDAKALTEITFLSLKMLQRSECSHLRSLLRIGAGSWTRQT